MGVSDREKLSERITRYAKQLLKACNRKAGFKSLSKLHEPKHRWMLPTVQERTLRRQQTTRKDITSESREPWPRQP